MPDNSIPEWKRIHEEATIVDVHAHPSLKASIFNRVLTRRFRATRSWNPFSVRTDFNKLKKGKVDVLWSTVYAPEREILKECRWVRLVRFIMPCKYRKIFYFKC